MTGRIWAMAGAGALAFLAGLLVTFEAIPRLEMKTTLERWLAAGNGPNVALHPGLPNEASRSVVRPSPDLAYVACAFDLTGGPIRINVSIPPTYWLLSFFDMRTDTFATLDRDDMDGGDHVILATRHQAAEIASPSGPVVVSPGDHGAVLARLFVPDRAEYGALRQAHQTRHTCEPLGGGEGQD